MVKKIKGRMGDGSVSKGPCHPARQAEVEYQDPRHERRELTPRSYPLPFIHASWHMHTKKWHLHTPQKLIFKKQEMKDKEMKRGAKATILHKGI